MKWSWAGTAGMIHEVLLGDQCWFLWFPLPFPGGPKAPPASMFQNFVKDQCQAHDFIAFSHFQKWKGIFPLLVRLFRVLCRSLTLPQAKGGLSQSLWKVRRRPELLILGDSDFLGAPLILVSLQFFAFPVPRTDHLPCLSGWFSLEAWELQCSWP